jgi:uncharacterized protein with HEPN domain
MFKRNLQLYIKDILESANAIKQYINNMDYETFSQDRKTFSATIREYIIIGEAITALMEILEEKLPEYPWRMVKDFRNLIIHEYFGVDSKIVWDLTTKELDELVKNIRILEKQIKNSN